MVHKGLGKALIACLSVLTLAIPTVASSVEYPDGATHTSNHHEGSPQHDRTAAGAAANEARLPFIHPSIMEGFRSDRPQEVLLALNGSTSRNAAAKAQDEAQRADKITAFTKALSLEIDRQWRRFQDDYAGNLTVLQAYKYSPVRLVRFNGSIPTELLRDRRVVSLQPNRRLAPELAQSKPLIGQPAAYRAGATGKGSGIAIVDTGVNYGQAAFGSCTKPSNTCKVVKAVEIATLDGARDDIGHGTNVAGIASGVAPQAKIVALDVFEKNGEASDSNVLKALDWVIANKTTYNLRAVNLSLGDSSHHTSECIDSVYKEHFVNAAVVGVVPVVSTGNAARVNKKYVSGVSSPACSPGAIRVGAVYDSNVGKYTGSCVDLTTQADQIACFSQGGPLVSVLAPGSRITAAGITQSGTSQAAPHVAGAIAALASKHPGASAGQLAQSIGQSRKLIVDPRESITGGYVFIPRLDMPRALSYLKQITGSAIKRNILIFGDADTGESTTGIDNLRTSISQLGFSVSYSETLPDDLSNYGQVWYYGAYADLGLVADRLIAFAKSGRSLYLTTEWSGCCNNGGSQAMASDIITRLLPTTTFRFGPDSALNTSAINSGAWLEAATKPNALTSFTGSALGSVDGTSLSSQHFLATEAYGNGTVVLWTESELGYQGRLALVTDVNWAQSEYGDMTTMPAMAQNLATYLAGP